jgi:hypothetical protein
MSLPFKSLDAATAPGPGASRDLEGVSARHTFVTTATGDPTSYGVALEGSHDEVTWFTLQTASGLSGTVVRSYPDGATAHLVRFVRVNLTGLSGGTSPTVTATIATETTEED